MKRLEIKTGCYYSNGLYGRHWSVRQVTRITSCDTPDNDQIRYKIVVGENRRQTNQCTRAEFLRWSQAEVYRNENSWQRMEI